MSRGRKIPCQSSDLIDTLCLSVCTKEGERRWCAAHALFLLRVKAPEMGFDSAALTHLFKPTTAAERPLFKQNFITGAHTPMEFIW